MTKNTEERIKQLEQEVYALKVQLKLMKDKAENWEKAYETAMNYAKAMLKRGVV